MRGLRTRPLVRAWLRPQVSRGFCDCVDDLTAEEFAFYDTTSTMLVKTRPPDAAR